MDDYQAPTKIKITILCFFLKHKKKKKLPQKHEDNFLKCLSPQQVVAYTAPILNYSMFSPLSCAVHSCVRHS